MFVQLSSKTLLHGNKVGSQMVLTYHLYVYGSSLTNFCMVAMAPFSEAYLLTSKHFNLMISCSCDSLW